MCIGRDDYPDDIHETTTGFPDDDAEMQSFVEEDDPEMWKEPYPNDTAD